MPSLSRRFKNALLALLTALGASLQATPTRYKDGSATDATPPCYGPVFHIGGGGGDVAAAHQAMIDKVRGATGPGGAKIDVVVLRCTGSNGYNAFYMAMNGVNSVETIVGTAPADFEDASVAQAVHDAEVVFLAGGNQADYVNFIRGTATDTAIKYVVSKGGAVGGTSAGAAIQGPIVNDATVGPNVISSQAMLDPYASNIHFTYDWFNWAHLQDVITDPHFDTGTNGKDRMGRLMTFVARQVKDGRAAACWGLGISANTSLLVDKDGLATVLGDRNVYLILLDAQPETCAAGQALTCRTFKIWRYSPGGTLDLAHRPTCGYYQGSIVAGTLSGNYYNAGTLADCAPPVLTAQPANQTVQLGATATFSVVATGSGLSYQWNRGNSPLPGATSANYTTPPTVEADNGATFNVDVSNGAGSVASASATLTVVVPAPTITTQPGAVTVSVGQPASFSVVASGASLAYQWRRNGSPIAGATAASYTTPATTSSDNGALFSVVVANPGGSVTSTSAALTVQSSGGAYVEVESNNTISTANNISAKPFPLTVTGSCASLADPDYFLVTVAAGKTLVVNLTVPSNGDYDLYLKNPSGTRLTKSINSGNGRAESMTYKNTGSTTATYYIMVNPYSGSSGPWSMLVSKQ